MYINIVIAVVILIIGVMISRLIQGAQLRRLDGEIRSALFSYTRGVRRYAAIPVLVAVVLFVVAVILNPESLPRFLSILLIATGAYIIVMNIFIFISYIRARCGVWFLFFSLIVRLIITITLALFYYYITLDASVAHALL